MAVTAKTLPCMLRSMKNLTFIQIMTEKQEKFSVIEGTFTDIFPELVLACVDTCTRRNDLFVNIWDARRDRN